FTTLVRSDGDARGISARIESRQCGSDGRRAQGSLARPLRKQRRPRREYRFPYLPDDSRFRFHYRPFPSKPPAGPHPKYNPNVRRTPQCPRSPSMPAESGLHGTWCATCSYVHFTVAGEAAFSINDFAKHFSLVSLLFHGAAPARVSRRRHFERIRNWSGRKKKATPESATPKNKSVRYWISSRAGAGEEFPPRAISTVFPISPCAVG